MRIRYFSSEQEAERLIRHLESVGVQASLEGLTPKEKSIWGRRGAAKEKALAQGFYVCKIVMPMLSNSWITKVVEEPIENSSGSEKDALARQAKELMKKRYSFDKGGSLF